MTKLEELKATRDAAWAVYEASEFAADADWVAYEAKDAAYEAELKKIQEENSDD
jgi:hypothetical protein